MKKDISIVIPLLDEEESIVELNDWINKVMTENKFSYEVFFIDDGSTDKSWSIIEDLNQKSDTVKGIKFRRNYGKSAALNVGFAACEGEVVFTMDADLQDSPEELPEMYKMITEQGFHIVSGWKKKRFDPLSKTIPTKLFNWATRKMTGIQLNDFNCGLKAYQNTVVKNIEVYGEMHRYIPAIAKWAGFTKITEKEVSHQERKYGVTKFGLERFINGFLDLLSINFVGKFGKRPMHFFGTLGTIVFAIGFAMVLFVLGEKLFYIFKDIGAPLVTDKPQFYVALISMVIGAQLFLAGFLAELVSRNSPNRNNYKIEQEVG
ncbi:MAG: glycosyltransferase family 2 protein [Vicingaceae bacterium]